MKLVRAKCEVTGKKLVMQVSDDGKEVIGYFRTDEKGYQSMQSQVRLAPSAQIKQGLTSCGCCKFASCLHKYKNVHCGAATPMDRDCLACEHLKADYQRAGRETIQLKDGEVAALELAKLKIGVGWDCKSNGGSIDVDTSVIMLSGDGKEGEEVAFYHLTSADGAVRHRGDNLTGRDGDVKGADDDENIDVNLDRVSAKYERLVFVINIYSGARNFRAISNLYLNIYDTETGDKLIGYTVGSNYSRDVSIVIGEAYRKDGGWEFKAIGEGTDIERVPQLREYCARKRW